MIEVSAEIARQILGGTYDYAVRARATWLWNHDRYDPNDAFMPDLSGYEAERDDELMRIRNERRRLLGLAAFANVRSER